MKIFDSALRLIAKHKKFLVTTHHNPDSDALASALSMALYLKSKGKSVTVVNEDACPDWLKFLPKTSLFKKLSAFKKIDYDVAIVLDCGDLKRVGGVAKFMEAGKPIVNIDHHITNDRFGSINIIDAKSSSTCEMLFSFFQEAKCSLTKDMAILLYSGVMTDTGSFRYDNTSAHTHAVTADLMQYKFSASQMYNKLYVGIPVGDMKLFAELIQKAELLFKNKLYCVSVSKKTVEKFSKTFDLKEKLFNFLRSVEGIEVVAILTEMDAKEVRVNLRSQNDFDVARFAQQFDGGGHRKAAGCKIYEPLNKAKAILCAAIGKKI